MFFAGLVLCLDGHIPISFDFKLLDGQREKAILILFHQYLWYSCFCALSKYLIRP